MDMVIGRLSAASRWRVGRSDGGVPGQEEAQRRLFQAIGEFLATHRLAPTPPNYAVAHAVVTGADPDIAAAVAEATDGGIRLTQAGADEIHARLAPPNDLVTAGLSVEELIGAIERARERFERYAGIVDGSGADARAYGEALRDGAAALEPAAAEGRTVAALLSLTRSMVEKTRGAEEQLLAASEEMRSLRTSLAAARQDADTDQLTGLPNRRAFEACFADRIAAAPGRLLSVALCDIDMFKAVNDRHGHDVGDRVICLVGRELAGGCGDNFVARYGGEEFVILFQGQDIDTAEKILDRTRIALDGRTFRIAGTDATLEGLSFSGGVIQVEQADDCRTALKRADAALYRAKQKGRNRIERG